jgi:cytochrome c biogenesis protein CcmG, thiol:disulfide interchange protein DsbE
VRPWNDSQTNSRLAEASMHRNRITALILGLAFLVVPVLAAAQEAAKPAPVAPVPAPDSKFLTLEGKPVSLSDYKGKVVLLDFWATWCGPCRMAMPGLQKIQNTMGSKGLVVLGVSLDRNPQVLVPPFLKNMGITYTNFTDNPKDPCSLKWDVRAIPSLYLIDRKGNIEHWWRGMAPEPVLVQAVEEALAAKK